MIMYSVPHAVHGIPKECELWSTFPAFPRTHDLTVVTTSLFSGLFLDSTGISDSMWRLSPRLTSLTIVASRFIRMVTNGKV